jgi:hypothetical protein
LSASQRSVVTRVAVLAASGMAPFVAAEGFDHVIAGSLPDVLLAETARRTGADAAGDPSPVVVAEYFAGARLDLDAGKAAERARDWAPDLMINEMVDTVGVYAARALGVPLATVATGPAAPAECLDAIAAVARPRFEAAGLTPPPGLPAGRWLLETCPDALGPLPAPWPAERWTLRPEAHRAAGGPGAPALAAPVPGRRRVLVTFGSRFADPVVVDKLLDDLTDGVRADFIGTALPYTEPPIGPRHIVPFQPLADLLPGVSAVVTHGGAGTVLGALAEGLPLVVVPQGADHRVQAAAVERAGCGVATTPGRPDPEQLRAAVRKVLDDDAIAGAAATVQKEIAAMTPPDEVAEKLVRAL